MKVSSGVVIALVVMGGTPAAVQENRPTFKGGVDLVTVSVIVHSANGRPVTGLSRSDFELFDAGERQSIVDFRSEAEPVSVAVLFDTSGSMAIPPKLSTARDAVRHLTSWLEPGRDRVALFVFDRRLQVLQGFTTDPADVLDRLDALRPFGSTLLYDAIAETGQRLVAEAGPRRAVVVVTDGRDNRSQLAPAEVSDLASSIDVPVYVFAIAPQGPGPLDDLARSTGGALLPASGPAAASLAARQVVNELRTQYVMAFVPSARAGWHPLAVRARNARFVVRTRSGYLAGPRARRD